MKSKKKIVEEYLKDHSITPVGYLAKDLTRNNWKALRFPAYAISNLAYLKYLPEKIKEIATVEIENNQTKSRYYNLLTEFFGAWFISDTLGLHVNQIEYSRSRASKIKSPHCSTDKSCDIMVSERNSDIYFEVKDMSSQTLSKYPDNEFPDFVHLTPPTPRGKKGFIQNQINEAVKKGANFLICRIPAWSTAGKPAFGTKWLKQIFPVKKIGDKEFQIEGHEKLPNFFQGVYLIKNRRYLLLRFWK